MHISKHRLMAIGAALGLAIVAGLPARGAVTAFPGSITLTAPTGNSYLRGIVPVTWKWRSGTSVKSTSTVDVSSTIDGYTWTPIATLLPIRSGSVQWNTAGTPDYLYAVRVVVHGTTIKSVASPLIIDNTAPSVSISKPGATQVVLDDQTLVEVRYVAGTASLTADTFDAMSGVASVAWTLDDVAIGNGTPLRYNFSTQPGKHTLTATAIDRSGNSSSVTIDIVAVPGPSVTEGLPTPPAVPTPPDVVPSGTPTAPAAPSVPPSTPPVPSVPPSPDPGGLPVPLPTP